MNVSLRNELKLTTQEHYTTISLRARQTPHGPHVRSLSFASVVNGQALTHLSYELDGKKISRFADLRIQIFERMEKGELNSSNSHLLPLLFQDAMPSELNRYSKSSNAALRLAVAWHLASSAAAIEDTLKRTNPKLQTKATLSDIAMKNFINCLEAELNCTLPSEVSTYFDTSKFENNNFLRSRSAFDAFQRSPQHHMLTKRSFKFMTCDIVPVAGQSFVAYESVNGTTVVYYANPDRVMAQQFKHKELIWSQQIESKWSSFSPFVDHEFLCFQPPPIIEDGKSDSTVVIFVSCSDRFAVNVLDLNNGELIWTFCSKFKDSE
ncbi:MAG: hypothetical protein R3C53_24675 [Pirellulaceae bacterium]